MFLSFSFYCRCNTFAGIKGLWIREHILHISQNLNPLYFRELTLNIEIVFDDAKNQQLRSSSVWIDDGNGYVQGRTCNRFKIEKKWYTGVVFAKHPLMIKLEWDSIEVYCERIQLENSFWIENCVSLLVLSLSDFIAVFVFNEQQFFAFILICNS